MPIRDISFQTETSHIYVYLLKSVTPSIVKKSPSMVLCHVVYIIMTAVYMLQLDPHGKNVWVILTCFCLPELLISIDHFNSDNHKWDETTQTFLQCICATGRLLSSKFLAASVSY